MQVQARQAPPLQDSRAMHATIMALEPSALHTCRVVMFRQVEDPGAQTPTWHVPPTQYWPMGQAVLS